MNGPHQDLLLKFGCLPEALIFQQLILRKLLRRTQDVSAVTFLTQRVQRAPNPPQFAQPHLSTSNGSHPQREGTNLGMFVPVRLVLPRREAANLGVFDLCHFDLLKRGCAIFLGGGEGLELAERVTNMHLSNVHFLLSTPLRHSLPKRQRGWGQ